jgi:hypothetical protein
MVYTKILSVAQQRICPAQGCISPPPVTSDRFELAESSAQFERKSPSNLVAIEIIRTSQVGDAGTSFALAPARIPLFLNQNSEFTTLAVERDE